MKLKVERIVPNLRLHTTINGCLIASRGYRIYKSNDNGETWGFCNRLPVHYYKEFLSKNRLVSRLLRLGISQIRQIFEDRLLICCDRGMFLSDLSFSYLQRTDVPARFFQLLDGNICVTPEYGYYGEYIPNPRKTEVNVFRTEDGVHWEIVYSFPKNTIRHIHVLQHDTFSSKIWFSTGDADAECMLGFADLDFSSLSIIGENSQRWRCLEFIFTEDSVYWGTDTPLVQNELLSYSRKDGRVETIANFDGPIYNLRRIGNIGYIIVTAAERGEGEWDNKAHVWHSTNLYDWEDAISFEKDRLPNLFGFGRLSLAENTREQIVLSALALKEVENRLLFLTFD
ncbi:MAG: hypothetical protein DDT40_00951 [candidate division WS2 bacterium]|nr:hypothetical protein [Bacillota bacterium]MBT9138918.1 hypothetical protein [Bacillota bacterium]MBT9150772.1 hypothetical protein [Candidatus Psychracetigena formicireducens]